MAQNLANSLPRCTTAAETQSDMLQVCLHCQRAACRSACSPLGRTLAPLPWQKSASRSKTGLQAELGEG